MKPSRFIPLTLFVVALVGAAAEAQTVTGSIVGTVRDESGAVLPGATVTVTSTALIGGPSTTTTTESGFYRFPGLSPGTYNLNVTLAGFTSYAEEGLRVLVGGTIERNLTLKIAAVAETVTVTGESPIVDTQATDVTTNYTREWVENAPIRRFTFFDLINAAPGVSPLTATSSRSSSFGGGTDDNSYQLDGTDFTAPLTGAAWPWPNTDVIEEIEVLSLGAPAEYGNLQGAVFNVVTRQGGNTYKGDVNFYYQAQDLTGRNTADAEDAGLPYNRDKYNDLTLHLGGPVIKDKFWFFGGYQYQRDFDSQPGTPAEFPAKFEADRVFFKLTYQANAKNKIMFAYHDDYYRIPGRATAVTAPTTIGVENGHNPSPNLTWTSIISDKTFFEARYSGFYGVDHGDPLQEGQPRVQRRFNDLGTGLLTGGIYSWYDGTSDKTAFTGKISHFADNFLGGSHDFKFGVQYNSGGGEYTIGRNDYIYTYYGVPQYGYTQLPSQSFGHVKAIGFFADDTFRLSDRVNLNLGVRIDRQTASIPEAPVLDRNGNETGQTYPEVSGLFTWTTASPRLGANIKLSKDGRSVIKAHYGRYYKGIVTGEFDDTGPGITPLYAFSGTYDAQGNPLDLTVSSDNTQLTVDSNYKNPYTDQFIIGFEHELVQDLALSASYVYKRSERQSGWQEVAGVYQTVPVVDSVTGQSFTGYRLLSAAEGRRFLLTNPDPGIRGENMFSRYNGFVVQVTKRMANRWQLVGSLNFSKSTGVINSSLQSPTAGQQTAALATFGQNPNDYANLNADSLLVGDRPVIGKIQLVYQLPYEVTLGLNYNHLEGKPWARQVRLAGFGFPVSPSVYGEALNGDSRLPNQDVIDMRVEKAFNLGRGTQAAIFGDFLNLTNDDANESIGSRLGTSASFGLPTRFIFPRRIMIGAKFRF